MSPNTEDHGKRAQTAWRSDLTQRSKLQKLWQSSRLCTLPASPDGSKPATVQIFTTAVRCSGTARSTTTTGIPGLEASDKGPKPTTQA
ncbi:hypothetical protein B0H65DRAFT_549594 [Neurospora tetraspora]|uniref:Uncharacterized protein n=1 Tax=Neurospora tetraspora TaxID=94610 RepID=A0AAE0JC01_9PEZI|nr:hypothetical protein B0H65DRAFT_549594 [Neurospora tetraspora]